MTGSTYLNLNYGPVPQYFDYHYYLNPYIEMVINEEKTMMIPKADGYVSIIEAEELTMIKAIYSLFTNHNSHSISALSHNESARKETKIGDRIPYDYASQLIHKI